MNPLRVVFCDRAVLDRQRLTNRVTAIYAGEVDTTELFLRAHCKIESDTLLNQTIAMAKYPA